MQIDITDEQLNGIVKQAVNQEVKRRIENSVNDGIAYWFSHQSIQHLTREILLKDYLPKITDKFIEGLNIDATDLSKVMASSVERYLLDRFGETTYEL